MRGRAADLGAEWPISPDCPSETYHNTLRAAYGQSGHNKRNIHPPCTCPHALELKHAELVKREQERKARRAQKSVSMNYHTNIKPGAPVIDMSAAGACSTDWGREMFDEYLDRPDLLSRERAVKAVCEDCPVRAECLRWVTSAEATPGAWSGVYAGLTPKERASLARHVA